MRGRAGKAAERRRAAAAEWHARMLEPESQAEVSAFEAWLGEHPDNPAAYAEMEAISALGRRLAPSAAPEKARRPAFGWRPALALALGAAVVLAGTALIVQAGSDPAYAAVSNAGPAIREVRLDDGTRVVLDQASEIGVALEGGTRRVEVRAGRARFAVAAGTRPFRVKARAARITPSPSGAVFDVALTERGARVSVRAGAVKVEAAEVLLFDKSVEVRPGWTARTSQDRLETFPAAPGEERWPASRVRFVDAPLGAVVARANRGGEPDIALAHPDLATLPVSGTLDLRDTRALARKLAAALGLRVEETPAGPRLTR